MRLSIRLKTWERFNANRMKTVENALFNIGIIPLQPTEQGLDLLAFRSSAAVVTDGTVFGKATGTLDKLQLIVTLPGENVVFMNAI